MQEKRPNLKKEQGAKTKEKLYFYAEKLFTEYDYDDVSVTAIAKLAGITKGTFYTHFKSKDELYFSLFSNYTAYVDAEYQAFLDTLPADLPAPDVLLALIDKIADILIDNVGYGKMKTVYQLQLSRNVNTDVIKGYSRQLYKIFSDVLDRGIQRGEFRTSSSLEELSRQFVMAIRGLSYEWCIRYPEFDLKKQAKTHFHLLLEGIIA